MPAPEIPPSENQTIQDSVRSQTPKTEELIRNDYFIKDNSNNSYYPFAISLDRGMSYFIMEEKFPGVTSFGETNIESAICFELPLSVQGLSFQYKNQLFVIP